MLIGAEVLRSDIDYHRLVSIVGTRGSGKDLLAHELASVYLDDGYKFYSNQFSVFNDDLYIEENGVVRPDIRRRVIVLTEGGKYLREWKYFEDLLLFARKLDNYFFFPSVRPPHAELLELTIYPIFPFRQMFGINGGLWGWSIDTGYSKKRLGKFIFLPFTKYVGVYDTFDFSETPDRLLKVIREAIEIDQKNRGRDGLQKVEVSQDGIDLDAQQAIARRFEQFTLSLQNKNKGR